MRGAVAVTFVLALACAAVPATAQPRDVKPMADTARETDKSSLGIRSVTGTVKKTTESGLVVAGRETGSKDRDWAFVLDGGTRIDSGGQVRGVSDLRQGDPVTVTYTNRDGKIVAQSVTGEPPLVRIAAGGFSGPSGEKPPVGEYFLTLFSQTGDSHDGRDSIPQAGAREGQGRVRKGSEGGS